MKQYLKWLKRKRKSGVSLLPLPSPDSPEAEGSQRVRMALTTHFRRDKTKVGRASRDTLAFDYHVFNTVKSEERSSRKNTDSDDIFFFTPSRNTDQGVYHACK